MLILSMVLVLAGMACASNESPTVQESIAPSESPAASAMAKDHGTKTFTTETFTVAIEQYNKDSDFYFEPTTIKAPGNANVTVQLKNEGDVEHTFTMDSPKVDHELQPGKSTTFEVKLGAETRYEFYCKYHKGSGMVGAFSLH